MATYDQKKSYLDILAVFHYVNGALTALMALAAVVFLLIGLGASSGWGDDFEPEPTCALVAIIFFVLVLVGGYAILNLLAGRALHTRSNRILVLITSGINCLNMPFGTLLGIFTFVMMVDPEVRWMFDHGAGAELTTGHPQDHSPGATLPPPATQPEATPYEPPPSDPLDER